MRAPLLFAFLTTSAACVASGKPDLQVTAVRYWTSADVTRIAIETNGDFTFKRDRLNNPDRLFFDIIDARPNVGGLRFSTRHVNDKFLKQIRIAETLPGRTRVVLDLNLGCDFTVSKLENPDRLMIELRTPSPNKKPDSAPEPATPLSLTSTPVIPASLTADPGPPPMTTALAKSARPDSLNLISAPAVPLPPAPGPSLVASSTPVASTTPLLSAQLQSLESAAPARKSTSDGTRSLIRALGLKINRVVIDAGHGGKDVGTSGPTGLLEKDLVLDVAMRLGKLIEQRLGAEVVYTRQDDTFVPLEERTAIANRSHADLFLSIHANSSPIKAVAGVETFYLNFTSSTDALDVAARENASSQKSVFELRDLIQSISLHDKIEESKEFATNIQRTMQANAVRSISSARDRGIKKAPFVVLIGAQMPSVLSEIGFVSNPREEALLKRGEHRQQIAEALYKGLSRYADSLSHIQVASQTASPVAKQ
ncbi:MAG TPA: N-acetylmuramoyl-L-alanine amidase [Bryobacteraceae bacterium]|jgi:N-acetylmuramoyl-L-alanine amidase